MDTPQDSTDTPPTIECDCVIAGGGPAGMVLGHLLARAGLHTIVLEKHADFLREFRGDTIHPSTLTLLRELGLIDRFLDLPLSHVDTMDAVLDGNRITLVDFSTLPGPDNQLVFAPQWDFLTFLAEESAVHPGFDLRMSTAATGLLVEADRIVGVRATAPEGDGGGVSETAIRAALTVAADGRGSDLRPLAGLIPVEPGAPIDVLWFHLPKPPDPPPTTLAYASVNGLVLTLDRGDSYQGGMVIPKGRFEEFRAAGLDAFRAQLAAASPPLAPVVDSLQDWEQIKLLSVRLDHLDTWHRPGFIAIGDAAHAMSPMFGVGVNYAIQDAVALANAVLPHLLAGSAPESVLAQVQQRRAAPARKMQNRQQIGHRGILRASRATGSHLLPRPLVPVLRLLAPVIRRRMGAFVGRGFLPEHVDPAPFMRSRARHT